MSARLPMMACMLAAAWPIQAQVARRPVPGDIVVTGRQPGTEREKAESFVRATGVAVGQRAAARWMGPICPRAANLQPAYAARVEREVRRIARSVGAPVAPAGCRANIAIIFTSDGRGLMRDVVKRMPRRLERVSTADRQLLTTGDAPVRWWHTVELRNRDGMPGVGGPLPWVNGGEGGLSVISDTGAETLAQYNASVVSTQAVRRIVAATVVVDVEQAVGVPLSSVSAYAAMVALAELRTDAPAASESILALFRDGERPPGLTDRDRRFLTTLYALPLDRTARQHRGRLVEAQLAGTRP